MSSIPAVRPSFPAYLIALTAALALTGCGGGAPNDTASQIPESSAPTITQSNGGTSDSVTTVSSSTHSSTTTNTTSPSTNTASPQTPANSDASSTGSNVSLSWAIPTQRTDNSTLPISQLAGYEIYYYSQNSSAGSGQVVKISSPQVTTYTTPTLPPGTYNFAIAALDTDGLSSDLSSPVTITTK